MISPIYKNKLTYILLGIIILNEIVNVSASAAVIAGGAAAGAIVANNARLTNEAFINEQSSSGCAVPLEEAKNKYGCSLEYGGSSERRIGVYICGSCGGKVVTDCKGNIVSTEGDIDCSQQREFFSKLGTPMLISFGISILLFIIFVLFGGNYD